MSNSNILNAISIAKPCSAKWNEMTGNEQVRFCRHCELNVTDLSQVTRAKAVKLVRKSKGRICLRIHRDPLGQIVTRESVRLYTISHRASRFAAGAFTAIIGLSAAAQGQTTASPSDRQTISSPSAEPQNPDEFLWFTGTVTDVNGAVVPGTAIVCTNEQTGLTKASVSDDAGKFRLPVSPLNTYKVEFSSPGFAMATIEKVAIITGDESEATVVMTPSGVTMGAVSVSIDYQQPLIKAVYEDDLKAVKRLLRSGVDVDQAEDDGTTALAVAVSNGNVEIVRRLIRAGANVNARASTGHGVLFGLDDESSATLLPLLLQFGADINQISEDGETPLMVAAEADQTELVKRLVDAGAMIDAQNNEGYSAVMLAAEAGNMGSIEALLTAGANVGLRNQNQDDALAIAKQNDHDDVAARLRKAGAVDTVNEQPVEK